MYGLIADYFGRRPSGPIECYVVRADNLAAWDDLPPHSIVKIKEGAGVTASLRVGRNTKSIVYSSDDHSVVQHESVHAFCAMTFGATGPIWYAEGMAEVGQYWRAGQLEVNISAPVVDYLTNAEPKKMRDIVAAGQITGDSWQAYAWRWALCHLLANNPNYADRFQRLGIAMMSGRRDSFDNAFGRVAQLISFEYDQFVQNFGNCYRVHLCVWDWESEPKKLSRRSAKARAKVEVLAKAGWQASKLQVVGATTYDYAAQGKWNINAKTETDADGTEAGEGRLVGVIFNEFELSEPFDLGKRGSFTASGDGHLFIRCAEPWTELSDNDGTLTLSFRHAKESTPSKN